MNKSSTFAMVERTEIPFWPYPVCQAPTRKTAGRFRCSNVKLVERELDRGSLRGIRESSRKQKRCNYIEPRVSRDLRSARKHEDRPHRKIRW